MSPAVDTVDVAVIIPAACELPVESLHMLYLYTSSLLIWWNLVDLTSPLSSNQVLQ